VVPQRSVLDALLLGEWEDRAEAGLFRYDVTACPTKLVRLGRQQPGMCWQLAHIGHAGSCCGVLQ